MPSWVVPAVAAELWGVSVEHVLAEIAAGRITSRREGEFIFVDVDPNAAHTPAPAEQRPVPHRRSLAWTLGTSEHAQPPLITAAEREALLASAEEIILEHDADTPSDSTDEQIDLDMPSCDLPELSGIPDDATPDWQAVRARVARTRVPPPRSAAA